MESAGIISIAHRGASAYAPENTVIAFDQAIDMGCSVVEFDLRLSADGHPVVLHDDHVDRTTDGRGRVGHLSLAELLRLDAGSWMNSRFAGARIPTLADALGAIVPRTRALIELKNRIDPAALEPILERHGALEHCVIGSFDPAYVLPFRRRYPKMRIAIHAEHWSERVLLNCRDLGADLLVADVRSVSVEPARAARRAGLELWCYTVNDIGLVAACAAIGVAGIVTDHPDLIRKRGRGA